MKRSHHLLLAAALCAVAGAGHADDAPPPRTYRIVSPDGHVTYSDRQPTDPRMQTRELGRAAPTAPLFTPGSQLLEPSKAPPNSPGRSADGLAPPISAAGKPFPPGLADAVLSVLGHQFFVQTLLESCARIGPAASERYQSAVRSWRDRNAEMLARSNRITFVLFTGEQRDLLRATARSRLQWTLVAPDASEEERRTWCERSTEDLAHGRMDLVGDARLGPIADFQAN